jgi:hypothetical protein
MSWKKHGCIFTPPGQPAWMTSHAAVPIALPLGGDAFRIYFSSRDADSRSHIGYFEIELTRPEEICYLTPEPVLAPGPPGTFDDAGTMTSWIMEHDGSLYLYYIGWNRGVSVPFRNSLGLAISEDGGRTFHRYASGPILDRSPYDPAFIGSAAVLGENGDWRMWYLSCLGWERCETGLRHRYHLKYAESPDGIHWHREGRVAIDFRDENEYAISRPCVLREHDGYIMWYSCRGSCYRVGLAHSRDGLVWHRDDASVGIDVSPKGWDSQMIEYAHVFQHNGRRYMLYNGNEYGKTGIGLAVEAP